MNRFSSHIVTILFVLVSCGSGQQQASPEQSFQQDRQPQYPVSVEDFTKAQYLSVAHMLQKHFAGTDRPQSFPSRSGSHPVLYSLNLAERYYLVFINSSFDFQDDNPFDLQQNKARIADTLALIQQRIDEAPTTGLTHYQQTQVWGYDMEQESFSMGKIKRFEYPAYWYVKVRSGYDYKMPLPVSQSDAKVLFDVWEKKYWFKDRVNTKIDYDLVYNEARKSLYAKMNKITVYAPDDWTKPIYEFTPIQ